MAFTEEEIRAYEERERRIRESIQQRQEQQPEPVSEPEAQAELQEPTRFTSGRGAGRAAFNPDDVPEPSATRQEIRDVIDETEVQTPERERGWITELGENLQNALDIPADFVSEQAQRLNEATGDDNVLKPVTQYLDDNLLSADEQNQAWADSPVGAPLLGGGKGIEAGALIPLTLAGRANNQATPWSDRPEVIKDKPIAEALFTLMEVATPSLLIPGGGTALRIGVGLAVESGLETAATVETSDDLIAGDAFIENIAVISDYIEPGSGPQVARDLKEGRTWESQALINTLGFLQNLGINFGMNRILAAVPKPGVKEAARSMGKPVEEVQESVANVNVPNYRPDYEPNEVATVDDAVEVASVPDTFKPESFNEALDDAISLGGDPETVIARDRQNAGSAWDEFKQDVQANPIDREAAARRNTEKAIAEREEELAQLRAMGGEDAQVAILERQIKLLREGKNPYGTGKTINDEALTAEVLRPTPVGDDLYSARGNYFTNVASITDDVGVQKTINEATKNLERMGLIAGDKDKIAVRVGNWLTNNINLIDDDFDSFVRRYSGDLTRGIDDTQTGRPIDVFQPGWSPANAPIEDVKTALDSRQQTTIDGLVATPVIVERLGGRVRQEAQNIQALNGATNPIDYSASVDRLMELVDKLNLFAVPLRRGKRSSSLTMAVQQRNFLQRLTEPAEVKAARKAPKDINEIPDILKGIKNKDGDVYTPRDYWEAAKAGDKDAQQTIDAYINALANGSPETAAGDMFNLNSVLYDQFRQGTPNAVRNIFYATMLSGTKTHSTAILNNLLRIVGDPVGAILSGEVRYGLGQMVGAWSGLSNGLQAARRAFATNAPLNGKSKLDLEVGTLKQRQELVEQQWLGVQNQLNREGASPAKRTGAYINYLLQTIGNSGAVSIPNRMLMSIDAATETIFATQVATGRGFKAQAEFGNLAPLSELVSDQLDEVFGKGLRFGTIEDPDVLLGAKNVTFSRDIPRGEDSTMLDRFFGTVQDASSSNAVFNFVVPFTRVSWNILDTVGSSVAAADPTGQLIRLHSRWSRTLKGEYGDVAQLQLKSQSAMVQATVLTGAMMALVGNVTGHYTGKGNLPRTSILVPANNDAGYIAIDYSRFEPLASILAITADVVRAGVEQGITRGEYDKMIATIMWSASMSTVDKTFMRGLNQNVGLLDPKNYGYHTLGNLGSTAGGVLLPAGARQLIGSFQPYQTNYQYKDHPLKTIIGTLQARLGQGVGLPVKYDEFSGMPIPKSNTFTAGIDNPFLAAAAQLTGETVYPGRISESGNVKPFYLPLNEKDWSRYQRPETPQEMRALLTTLRYSHDSGSSLRTFRGQSLSPEQQSKVQRMMGETGALTARLGRYFDSKDFRANWTLYLRARAKGEDTTPHLQQIHTGIRRQYQESKSFIIPRALADDPQFIRTNGSKRLSKVDVNVKPSGVQSLYDWADGKVATVDIDYAGMMNN